MEIQLTKLTNGTSHRNNLFLSKLLDTIAKVHNLQPSNLATNPHLVGLVSLGQFKRRTSMSNQYLLLTNKHSVSWTISSQMTMTGNRSVSMISPRSTRRKMMQAARSPRLR